MIKINTVSDLKKAILKDSNFLDNYLEIIASYPKKDNELLLQSLLDNYFFLFLINLDNDNNHILLAKTINYFQKVSPETIALTLKNQIYYKLRHNSKLDLFISSLKTIANVDLLDYSPKLKVPEFKEKPKKQLKNKKKFNIGILF